MDKKEDKIDAKTAPEEKSEQIEKSTPPESVLPETKHIKSQAQLDMEATTMGLDNNENSAKKTEKSPRENIASIARFKWILLLLLSIVGVLTWTADAFASQWPFKWLGVGLSVASLGIGLAAFKFISLPTRAATSALIWAFCFLTAAAYGPPNMIFNKIPAAVGWSAMLIFICLWLGLGIWRRLGRFKILDIIISVIVIYAALSPVFFLINYFSGSSQAASFQYLSVSPAFIADHLPWCISPMGLFLWFVLPLCVFFALWDQASVLKRSSNRHPGNLIFAFSFLLLLPYCFLSYPAAKESYPELTQYLRSLYKVDSQWRSENQDFFSSDTGTEIILAKPAPTEIKPEANIEKAETNTRVVPQEAVEDTAKNVESSSVDEVAKMPEELSSTAAENTHDSIEKTQEQPIAAPEEHKDAKSKSAYQAPEISPMDSGITLRAYRLQQEQIERLEAKVYVMNDRLFELESRIRQLESLLFAPPMQQYQGAPVNPQYNGYYLPQPRQGQHQQPLQYHQENKVHPMHLEGLIIPPELPMPPNSTGPGNHINDFSTHNGGMETNVNK